MKTKDIPSPGILLLLGLLLILPFFSSLRAQKLDVAYVPTPYTIAENMLDVAGVGPGDYVIDLGSGDGRIVIAAAKLGAFGHGVELDPKRVREAELNALKAGVSDKVMFLEENIYETDFSRATVITLYLFPTINIKLRPSLLEKLEPGTKIVSHDFGMDDWKPDKHVRFGDHSIYLWMVPARISGYWMWRAGDEVFVMTARQQFQEIDLYLKSGNIALPVDNVHLKGKRISFTAFNPLNNIRYLYSGAVEGNDITGFVQVHEGRNKSVEPWNAVLE
ncbi:MAG: 50S ribosomal protein L11 methyltransferase [Prolixibacteraceae bacterium]|nr:50S ribosomal protein L11 methyltransferase [Prolixibacteraceae bacterium]